MQQESKQDQIRSLELLDLCLGNPKVGASILSEIPYYILNWLSIYYH